MGADGVLVGGCHPADCHYISGNYKARRRIAILKNIFETLGLDSERIELKWISASEGTKFARTVEAFTNKFSEKGPNDFEKLWNI